MWVVSLPVKPVTKLQWNGQLLHCYHLSLILCSQLNNLWVFCQCSSWQNANNTVLKEKGGDFCTITSSQSVCCAFQQPTMLVSTNEQASTISFTVFREVNEDCCATTPFQQFYHIKEWGGLIVSNKTRAFGVSPEYTSWQLTTQSISKKKSVGYHTMSLFLMVCIISNCTFINLFKIFSFFLKFYHSFVHMCVYTSVQILAFHITQHCT